MEGKKISPVGAGDIKSKLASKLVKQGMVSVYGLSCFMSSEVFSMGFREVADVFEFLGNVSPAQKLIVVALADRANQEGVSWPSIDELVRRTNQSKSSVLRHLRQLEKWGVLRVMTRRKQLSDGRWVRETNLYQLNLVEIRSGVFMQVDSGCQFDTSADEACRNSQVDSGCQFDTSAVPKCQNRAFQGVTGDTYTNHHINNHPSPQPPIDERFDAAGDRRKGVPGREGESISGDIWGAELAPAPQPPVDDFGDVEMSLTFPAPVANASGQEQHTGAQSDFVQLAQEVLPPQMQAMSPSALAEVGKMIAERVGVGWTKAQITAVLAGRALPDQVKVMAGLVKARLRDDISLDEVPKIGKSSLAWSHTLPDGRVVTRRDLDTGTLAIDFHQARIDGLWVGEDRWEFAIAQGVERYLV